MVAMTEIRATSLPTGDNGITATVNGGTKQLIGWAIVYNTWSKPLNINGRTVLETIRPGATKRALTHTVKALIEHQPELLLGSYPGTMKLDETALGLRFAIDLPNTSYANDLWESISRGDIGGCSFRFGDAKDKLYQDSSGMWRREITDMDIAEITITAFPAYPATVVEGKQGDRARTLYSEAEKARKAGDTERSIELLKLAVAEANRCYGKQ